MAVNGTGNSQLSRTYGASNSPSGNTNNGIKGLAGLASTSIPSKGGRRSKTGGVFGSLGPVINQAAVPFSILALQQSYGRRRGTKKYRGHRRR